MVAVGILIDRIEAVKSDADEVFGGRYAVENDGLVAGQAGEKVDNRLVAGIGEEGVVPFIDQVGLGQILDLREVHHHPVGGIPRLVDDPARERDFDGVTMPVQVTALAFVIRDAVSGIEFEAARDEHGNTFLGAIGNYTMGHAYH